MKKYVVEINYPDNYIVSYNLFVKQVIWLCWFSIYKISHTREAYDHEMGGFIYSMSRFVIVFNDEVMADVFMDAITKRFSTVKNMFINKMDYNSHLKREKLIAWEE